MSPSNFEQSIKVSFPEVTVREATELAKELRLVLIAAGADASDVRTTRTSDDSMDPLSSALLIGSAVFGQVWYDLLCKAADKALEAGCELSWKFVEGFIEEGGRRTFRALWEFFTRKNKVLIFEHPNGRRVTIGSSVNRASGTPSDNPALDTAAIIILGASQYPNAPALNNTAFARSAAAMRQILGPPTLLFSKVALLDLFDAEMDGAGLIREIRKHLGLHPAARDVFIYYCGHGKAIAGRQTALTLRGYSPAQASTTTLRLEDFLNDLEDVIVDKRLYMFFDCCFAGGALNAFQPPSRRFEKTTGSSKIPARAWAALVASGSDERAIAPSSDQFTMFSEALIHTIRSGIPHGPTVLSLQDVHRAMRGRIESKHTEFELPQKHEYWPDQGDLLEVPVFKNTAAAPIAHTTQKSLNNAAPRENLGSKTAGLASSPTTQPPEVAQTRQDGQSGQRVALPNRRVRSGLPTYAVGSAPWNSSSQSMSPPPTSPTHPRGDVTSADVLPSPGVKKRRLPRSVVAQYLASNEANSEKGLANVVAKVLGFRAVRYRPRHGIDTKK